MSRAAASSAGLPAKKRPGAAAESPSAALPAKQQGHVEDHRARAWLLGNVFGEETIDHTAATNRILLVRQCKEDDT